MSQRSQSVNEEFEINLKLTVNIESFSNHDGFEAGQIEDAIEEFKSKIVEELKSKLSCVTHHDEFLYNSDFVTFTIK